MSSDLGKWPILFVPVAVRRQVANRSAQRHLAPWKWKVWNDMQNNDQESRPNLTDARIKKTSWNGKEQRLTDPKLPGFIVSINKHSKTYKIKADLWGGKPGRKKKVRTITHAIGDAQKTSVRDGRDRAADLLRKIHSGEDPFRQATDRVSSSTTIDQLIELFIADRIRKKRRDATIKHYRAISARYLADVHHLPISEFEEADAYDLHNHITDNRGPVVSATLCPPIGEDGLECGIGVSCLSLPFPNLITRLESHQNRSGLRCLRIAHWHSSQASGRNGRQCES